MTTFNEENNRLKLRNPFNHSFSFDLIDIELGYLKNVNCAGVGVDISETGLGMASNHALKKAQVVKLYLPFYEKDMPLPVFAEVMWSKADNSYFRTGLRFLYLNVTNFGLDL
ncbi:MAG: PilZ domain-containing protein [Nitrospinae bacterium]|nr:PilZ domain-containing protein [Nitrospinota bacterium]